MDEIKAALEEPEFLPRGHCLRHKKEGGCEYLMEADLAALQVQNIIPRVHVSVP